MFDAVPQMWNKRGMATKPMEVEMRFRARREDRIRLTKIADDRGISLSDVLRGAVYLFLAKNRVRKFQRKSPVNGKG